MSVNGYSRGWNAAVEAAAKRAESAGCISTPCGDSGVPQAKHHSQCPIFLAAELRKELGEGATECLTENLLACGHPAACEGLAGVSGDQYTVVGNVGTPSTAGLIDHLSRTYDHFSGGRISKPLTLPEEVFAIADDLATKELEDRISEWQDERNLEDFGR